MSRSRRWAIGLCLCLFCLALASGGRATDAARYLRIGTGPPGETHFLFGSVIASAISAPPGLPSCAHGGACGVPGLIAVASTTSGSVANCEAIAKDRLDAALVQADVPWWAATGAPPFRGRPITTLRAIGNLGQDQIQLVVRKDGPIHTVRDLRGKHISLGEIGSGTEAHARLLLDALELKANTLKIEHLRSALAADALQAGHLDAFFVMDRAPVPTVMELAKTLDLRLIAIVGPMADTLRRADPLLTVSSIAAGTYPGIDSDTPTLAIGVTLVVAATLPEPLVYAITESLWQDETQRLLRESHHGAARLTLGDAVSGLGLPLHPGAQRYYADHGVGR